MLIRLLIYGGMTLVGGAASFLAFKKTDLFNKKKTIGLAVLGLKGSGKTTLQNYLRNTSHGGSTPLTGTSLHEVRITSGDRTIIIKSGKDVSGSDEAITHQYEELIEQCDHILFITDANRLNKNKEYHKKSRGLLNKINKKLKTEKDEKKLILIGSHKDLLEKADKSNANDEFLSKQFEGLNENVSATILMNFTSEKDLKKLKTTFFK